MRVVINAHEPIKQSETYTGECDGRQGTPDGGRQRHGSRSACTCTHGGNHGRLLHLAQDARIHQRGLRVAPLYLARPQLRLFGGRGEEGIKATDPAQIGWAEVGSDNINQVALLPQHLGGSCGCGRCGRRLASICQRGLI